jgi:hypothetical protein
VPADQTGGSDERDESNQEVSRSEGFMQPLPAPPHLTIA